MSESWNKKQYVEDSRPQWGVIFAILFLLLIPIIGAGAILYFYMNGTAWGVLLAIGGLCLVGTALPVSALFFLSRRAQADRAKQ